MDTSPIRSFDPVRVAYLEKENWVAYYQKRWLRLLSVSVRLVGETFGLSAWQSLQAAYLVARAEIAAAPFPDNNVPKAEAYMRRFYAFLQRIHNEPFDVDRLARLEVNWWVVHRRLAGEEENGELVEALMDLYTAVYGVDRESLRPAAYHRAQAMLFSDRWVIEGLAGESPLLEQEEAELVRSYTALKEAIR